MAAPSLFQTPLAPRNGARLLPPVQVDIVVPVYNEQAGLERSIRRLHRFLDIEFPFTWRIVIADNASTDDTPAIARVLARTLGGVQVLRLERKGRGRALRAAWSASDARVVAYMDVDLSTDLRGAAAAGGAAALRPLGPRDRHAAGPRRPRRARSEARADLARLQRDPAHRAARPLLRRPVRLQGRAARGAAAAAGRGPRRRVVLRHRAARAGPAPRAADPRGAGRLDRRPGLARRDRAHRARRPARRRAADVVGADLPLHGRRGGEHDRLRAALPRAARVFGRRAAPTRWRSRSPRWRTRPRTGG